MHRGAHACSPGFQFTFVMGPPIFVTCPAVHARAAMMTIRAIAAKIGKRRAYKDVGGFATARVRPLRHEARSSLRSAEDQWYEGHEKP